MNHAISVSDEELLELDTMLASELSDTRGELRRTRNPSYRKQVSHHMQVIQHLHDVVERELAGAGEAASS